MASWLLLAELFGRVTIVLALGWIVLEASRRLHPRWSVTVARAMVVGSLGLPLAHLAMPGIPLALLPSAPRQQLDVTSSSLIATAINSGPRESESTVLTSSTPGNEAPEPPATALSPASDIDRSTPTEASMPQRAVVEVASVAAPVPPSTTLNAPTISDRPAGTTSTRWPVSTWALFGWLMGIAALWLRLGWLWLCTCRLTRDAVPTPDWLEAIAHDSAEQLQLAEVPVARFSSRVAGPCTAGLLRPVVLLPQSWQDVLPRQDWRPILLHEFAHIAGHDVAWDFLARMAAALWWPHPLIWWLPARHRLDCEHACDAAAAGDAGFAAYRQTLAQLTLRRQGTEPAAAMLPMAQRSMMLKRLRWLEQTRPLTRPARRLQRLLLTTAALVTMGVAVIALAPAVEAEPRTAEPSPAASESAAKSSPAAGKTNSQADRRPDVADIDLSRTEPKKVRVVDESEQPVVGATVVIGWWEDAEGDLLLVPSFKGIKQQITDAAGDATIDVPHGAARAQLSAEAPGYASAGKQYSLAGVPTLKLEKGRTLRVRAVDANGEPRPEAYPLLGEIRVFGREFQRVPQRPGEFESPVVKLDRRWLRVVDGSGTGPILFSELIDVDHPEHVDDDGSIRATLKPGVALRGRLSAEVPRPIQNGCVELYIVEGAGHQIARNGWIWQDTATVATDGTFEFPSLPTGGTVQLVALVDGYQSKRPTAANLRDYLTTHQAGEASLIDLLEERRDAFWPQLFALPSEATSVDIELPCVPTAAVDVRVLDPTGRPLPDATVRFNPNGCFVGGELFIPTTETFTPASLVRRRDNEAWKRLTAWSQSSFLSCRSDATGIAHVRNLPGDLTESYRVDATGYVMPMHPTSSFDDPTRYAVVDLVAGKTVARTVTMETFVPRAARDLQIVTGDLKPIADIEVTVNELAFADAPEAWELWAVQRFGPVATGKTRDDGIVRLQVPTQVGERAVARLRIALRGRVGKDAYVQQSQQLSIPVASDNGIVVLVPSQDAPRERGEFRRVSVAYQRPETVVHGTPQEVAARLLQSPSLVLLQHLLTQAKYDATTPLDFCPQRNLLRFSEKDKTAVALVPTPAGDRIIVLCNVRPKDAVWQVKPENRFPPQAAYVFNASDGVLLNTVGGWAASGGDYNSIMLTNLGGTTDYFIETSAFESHGPYEYVQRWYHVGRESRAALTTYGYANATSWNGTEEPSKPPGEFGYIGFKFNGRDIKPNLAGTTATGAQAPREVYWDARQKSFIGATEEWFDGQPLYRVVTDESHFFTAMTPQPGDLIVAGGRYNYDRWHAWDVVVPKDKSATAQLLLLGTADGAEKREIIHSVTLAAGQHSLQLQVRDHAQQAGTSLVELRSGDKETIPTKTITTPHIPLTDAPSVPNAAIARTSRDSLNLFERAAAQPGVQLVWQVRLVD